MNFLTHGLITLEFAVDVEADSKEEAELKGIMLANSTITEVIVLTSKSIPIKLKVHNSWGECESVIEIDDEKENHQTSAIA